MLSAGLRPPAWPGHLSAVSGRRRGTQLLTCVISWLVTTPLSDDRPTTRLGMWHFVSIPLESGEGTIQVWWGAKTPTLTLHLLEVSQGPSILWTFFKISVLKAPINPGQMCHSYLRNHTKDTRTLTGLCHLKNKTHVFKLSLYFLLKVKGTGHSY